MGEPVIPSPSSHEHLGTVFLISAAAELTHVGALLRRFGFEVRELGGIPTPVQISYRERCEVQLVIVDEALCSDAAPVARLVDMLSLSSVVIVPRPASRGLDRRPAASDRCCYLSPSYSPIDLTLTIVELLRRRQSRAN
jgi:hypothetical protein